MYRYMFVFIILSLSWYLYIDTLHKEKVDEHKIQHYKDSQRHYEETIEFYKINSDITFANLINTPSILNILKDIDNKNVDTNSLRKNLYKTLKQKYKNLKMITNVRQLHFHHNDGRSFLRMHRPNKYGDPLFDVRESVRLANIQKRFVQGFEEGRIFNGYRFVYPIIYNQKHLGSVEISISMDAITKSLKKSSKRDFCFLLDNKTINKKLFKNERSNYALSSLSDRLSVDISLKNQHCHNDLIIENFLKKDEHLKEKIKNFEPINELAIIGSNTYLLNMLPIKNLKDKNVAYLYTVYPDKKIDAFNQIYIYNIFIFNLIIMVILGAVYFFRQKQIFLKKQSVKLESIVYKRTQKIQRSLKKERHIKNLLQTVFDVSEHLNTVDRELSLLEKCCERIITHKNYSFAYINLFEDKQNKYFLNHKYQNDINHNVLEEIHNYLKSDEESLEKLNDGKVIIKNCSDDGIYSNFITTAFENEIKSMILIPIKNNVNYFGYLLIFSTIQHDMEEEKIIFHELGQAISKSIASIIHQERNDKLQKEKIKSYKDIIYALVDLTEKRDTYTAGHTKRVAEYCIKIAKKLNLDKKDLVLLEEAAMLHDIGKIVTPDSILLKPSSLSKSEYNIIQDHVQSGESILNGINLYEELLEVMRYHHEKYDGSGYPYGLKGDKIPYLSRIMTIADSFDAMTTNRIYKPRKELSDALNELKKCKGSHFDPQLVDAAVEALKNIKIDFNSSQLPSSGPDYERLAYHFRDPLTELYNKNYLLLLIENGMLEKNFECLNIILLNNFHDFNNKYGWESGNQFLKKFAESLEKNYPDSYLFRIFGDDFIILNFKHIDIKVSDISNEDFIKENSVGITVEHHDMRDKDDKKQVIKMLEVHI